MSDRKPHPLTSAKAYYAAGGQLAVVVECPPPARNALLGLDRISATVEPPSFELYSYAVPPGQGRPGLPAPLGIKEVDATTVQFTRVFQIGVARETIRIYHADGVADVPVVPVYESEPRREAASVVSADDAATVAGGDGTAEGIGFSSTSFDDAFNQAAADALGKLPPSHVVDGMDSVELVAAGSKSGGIVGFVNQKWVRVRAWRDGFHPGTAAGPHGGLRALNAFVASPPAFPPAPPALPPGFPPDLEKHLPPFAKVEVLTVSLAVDPPTIWINGMSGPGGDQPQSRDVRLTLTVTNPSKLLFLGGHINSGIARFSVLNGKTTIWHYPDVVLNVLTPIVIGAGESRPYHATWRCPDVRALRDADLTAVAEFVPNHKSATQRIDVRIAY